MSACYIYVSAPLRYRTPLDTGGCLCVSGPILSTWDFGHAAGRKVLQNSSLCLVLALVMTVITAFLFYIKYELQGEMKP